MIFFHTGLTVSNIEEAKALFTELLGMTLTSERELQGPYLSHMLGIKGEMTARIAMLQADENSFLELVEYTSQQACLPGGKTRSDITITNTPHFAYFAENLEEFHSRISPYGLQPLAESLDIIPGGPFAGGKIRFYRSSFGCLLEVIQRPD